MQIFFKTLAGRTIPIELEHNDTVLSVKEKIAVQQGFTSVEGLRIILAGKELLDNDQNFWELKPWGYATIHLIIPKSITTNGLNKYLMLDHGGVLDGIVTQNPPGNNDLLLKTYEWGGYQILENGVQIVNNLKELQDKYGYKILFHSKNKEEDQVKLLKQLQYACFEKQIEFPQVTAMAVCDNNRFLIVDSTAPILYSDEEYKIKVAGYGIELDGKTCVRNALSSLLNIPYETRKNHIVFDDGDSIVAKAIEEGYSAYLIGTGPKKISLNDAVKEVVENAKKDLQVKGSNTISPLAQNTLFTSSFHNIPLEFRQFFSAETQKERHKQNHISTKNYWDTLPKNEKEDWLKKFEKTRHTNNNNNTTTNSAQPFKQLSENQRKFIADETKTERSKFGNIPVEEYRNQIGGSKQQELLQQYNEKSSDKGCVLS